MNWNHFRCLMLGLWLLTVCVSGIYLSACTASTTLQYIAEPAGQDYWQTSAETIQRGGGDCEDLAIEYWSRHQDAWMVQGVVGDLSHVWVEDGKGNILFSTAQGEHEAIIYFNSECYHLVGKHGCGDASHIVKWRNVVQSIAAIR